MLKYTIFIPSTFLIKTNLTSVSMQLSKKKTKNKYSIHKNESYSSTHTAL